MFNKLPKVELHCHLDGSLRPSTILDIAQKEGISLRQKDIDEIKKAVIAPEKTSSLDEYLERFYIPAQVMQSKESLRRVAYELMEDAARENVKYIEIRFAPKFHMEKGLSLEEIIESVINGIKDGEKNYEIKGNLILCCMRHMTTKDAVDVVEAGREFLGKGVVAIDLAGSEKKGFAEQFIEPIALAKAYGYRVTIHAGETGIGRNVLEAIEILGAERIGHGVYIKDCKEAYDIVKEKGIILEMCPTSNVQTKAVKGYEDHPFGDFYSNGIKVSINTDNRTVSNVNMTKECEVVFDNYEIDLQEYKKIYKDSVEASFCNENTKEWLMGFCN